MYLIIDISLSISYPLIMPYFDLLCKVYNAFLQYLLLFFCKVCIKSICFNAKYSFLHLNDCCKRVEERETRQRKNADRYGVLLKNNFFVGQNYI